MILGEKRCEDACLKTPRKLNGNRKPEKLILSTGIKSFSPWLIKWNGVALHGAQNSEWTRIIFMFSALLGVGPFLSLSRVTGNIVNVVDWNGPISSGPTSQGYKCVKLSVGAGFWPYADIRMSCYLFPAGWPSH